jgi:hypothetical protein
MFGKFFKRKSANIPEFQALELSVMKDKYFVRAQSWDLLPGDGIYVVSVIEGQSRLR